MLKISDDIFRQANAEASAGGCKVDRKQPRSGEGVAAVDVWEMPLAGK